MLDGGKESAGEGFHGQSISPEDLDQLAKLGSLLRLDLFGLVHKDLEFGIEVARLAGHKIGSKVIAGRG